MNTDAHINIRMWIIRESADSPSMKGWSHLLQSAPATNGTEKCFSQTHLFCSIISVLSFMYSLCLPLQCCQLLWALPKYKDPVSRLRLTRCFSGTLSSPAVQISWLCLCKTDDQWMLTCHIWALQFINTNNNKLDSNSFFHPKNGDQSALQHGEN